MTLDLIPIRERLAAATPGPWKAKGAEYPWMRKGQVFSRDDTQTPNTNLIATISPREPKEKLRDELYFLEWKRQQRPIVEANAALIANAPSDIAALVAEVEKLTTAWQPIATAPKDGTKVDLWTEHRDACGEIEFGRKADCRWRNGWVHKYPVEFRHAENGAYCKATHWMLSPAPPQALP